MRSTMAMLLWPPLVTAIGTLAALQNSPAASQGSRSRSTLLRLHGGAVGAASAVTHTAVEDPTLVPTEPFDGQKPGTSGLRKKTAVFMEPRYLENFVQSIFDSLPPDDLHGSTLVVSGDGRFHNAVAIQTICKMAAANSVARVWVGVGGLLSTPSASAVIREREGGAAKGGTSSLLPQSWWTRERLCIKYNVANGGPAPRITDAVFQAPSFQPTVSVTACLKSAFRARPSHFRRRGRRRRAFFEVEIIDPAEIGSH